MERCSPSTSIRLSGFTPKEHELGTRRGQVLQELGLTDRIITDFTQIPSAEVKNGTAIDYSAGADAILQSMRDRSIAYLKKSVARQEN